MPANTRVRCQFLDCEKLVGIYCGSAEVEFNPKAFCLSYSPVKLEDTEDLEEEFEEEELGEEEDWLDEEEEDEIGDQASLTADD